MKVIGIANASKCFFGAKNATMKNEITFNTKFKQYDGLFYENEQVRLKTSSGKTTVCTVTYKSYESNIQIYISRELKSFFENDEAVDLENIVQERFCEYALARVEDVKNDRLILSESVMQKFQAETADEIVGVKIINNLNGYMMYIPFDSVEQTTDTIPTLRLNSKQRKLIDVELPTYISDFYLEDFSKDSESCLYKNAQDNLCLSDAKEYFPKSQAFKQYVKKHGIKYISIYPVTQDEYAPDPSSRLVSKMRSLKESLLKHFIGQKELTLRTVRPYPIDESESIVRVTRTTMNLLGVEETDNILLSYKGEEIRAKVLCIDDEPMIIHENRFKEPNKELNFVIGVPTHLRKKLHMSFINECVVVKRDMGYFFKKNMNNQMITIIGVILSIPFISDLKSIHLKIGIPTILALFFFYISFSEIREKISD